MTSRDTPSPSRTPSVGTNNPPPSLGALPGPGGTHAAALLNSPPGAGGSGVIHTTNQRPRSLSEWQLYAVLHRANLLQYYEIFISQGGDDVQQLLEAGEEEFLEIMALVGMASKPLHVRRLQKALQQQNQLQAAVATTTASTEASAHSRSSCSPITTGAYPVPQGTISGVPSRILSPPGPIGTTLSRYSGWVGAHGGQAAGLMPGDSPGPPMNGGSGHVGALWATGFGHGHLGTAGATAIVNPLPGGFISSLPSSDSDLASDSSYSGQTPVLTEDQINKLIECSREICKNLPLYEPKLVQNKKKVSRDLLAVMEMKEDTPFRMEEFRRYAAIYGRFDAKRKPDKPLTLHEVSVNEAAAQICLHRPSLLTRRDELFPLARQVVRDAGYAYLKGPNKQKDSDADDLNESPPKRPTPAESVSSSDRSHTPSSSTAGTPPVVGSSYTEPNFGGSPHSATSGWFLGSNGKETELQSLFSSHSELLQLDCIGRRLKLGQICAELQRVLAEQEACKYRVQAAQDPLEITMINRDLNRLSQRQMELSNQQAIILSLEKGHQTATNKRPTESRSDRNNSVQPDWRIKEEPVFGDEETAERTTSNNQTQVRGDLDARKVAETVVGKVGMGGRKQEHSPNREGIPGIFCDVGLGADNGRPHLRRRLETKREQRYPT